MAFAVDVLALGPLPVVRLIVDVPAGRAWKVTGRAGEHEWLAGEGTSTGGEVVFSDPWAPLGVPVTYTLSHASVTESGGAVMRSYSGNHALTSLDGRTVADFRWVPGDPWSLDPRAVFVDPWGSSLPVPVVGSVAGAGGGAVTAKTVGAGTRALLELVEANRPLLLMHNAGVCRMPDCDVPPVRSVLLTNVSVDRSARRDVSERVWDLQYRLVPRPYGFLAPVATWGDVKAHWSSNAALAASGLDVAGLRRGDWLVQ